MRKWLAGRRKLVAILLLVLTLTSVLPGVASATDDANSDNFVTRLVADLIDGVRNSFQSLGMQTVGDMVYNKQCTASGLGKDRTVTCVDASGRMLGNTFTAGEWNAVKKVAGGLAGLFGLLMVMASMSAGIQLADSGADERKRAAAMEKLKNMAMVAILMGMVGPALYLIFEINDVFVKLMGNIGGAVDFSQLFNGTVTSMSTIGRALVGTFGIITEVSLNLTYTMRKFGIMALICITPIAMYCFIFERTREVTKLWFQELLSNIAIQTTHAILLALFFSAYGTSGSGTAWGALCFLMILAPTTNMLRSIITSGRASNFTGMGLAAAMTGVGTLVGVGKMATAAGSMPLLSTLGRTGAGALAGVRGFGSPAMMTANGQIPPEMMAALSTMSEGAAPASSAVAGAGGGGGGKFGPSGPTLGGGFGSAVTDRLRAVGDSLGMSDDAGTAKARAGVYAGDRSRALATVREIANGASKVGGAAGSAVGAVLGGGVALATGDASYMAAGAALGNRLGGAAGRVAGATAGTVGGGAALVGSGAGRAATAASTAFQTGAAASGAGGGVVGSLKANMAGVASAMRAGSAEMGRHVEETLKGHTGGNASHLKAHEQAEAHRYNLARTIGGAFAGQAGETMAMKWADHRAVEVRDKNWGLTQMGELRDKLTFSEGDEVTFSSYGNRTDVFVNDERVDFMPGGHPDATPNNPVHETYRWTKGEEGQYSWQAVERKDIHGPHIDTQHRTVENPYQETPGMSWERKKGHARGGLKH